LWAFPAWQSQVPPPSAPISSGDKGKCCAAGLWRARRTRAAAASVCVPIRFEPVIIDGRHPVDGALTAPLPVDAARALGADVVNSVDMACRP
jgi:predicted acylesterase/phospholipase RssA